MRVDTFGGAEWRSKASYPRTRKSVEIEPYEITTKITYDISWGADTETVYVWPIIGSYRIMNDIVTPGFEELKAKGVIVNNPCRQYSFKLEPTPATRVALYNSYWGTPPQNANYKRTWTNWLPMLDSPSGYGDPVAITPLQKDNAIRLAIIEAYAKLNTTVWQTPVDLLELHKTLKMLGNAIQHFRGGIRYLRSKTRKRPKRRKGTNVPGKAYDSLKRRLRMAAVASGDAASNKTLEYLYGWLPLVMSIEDAIEALKRLEPVDYRQAVSASCPLEDTETVTTATETYPLGVGNGTLVSTKTTTRAANYRARCGIYAHMRATWHNAFGLTPWNAPYIVWELTKLSFVVDWFLKIGNWLEALKIRMEAGIEFSWLTVTDEQKTTQSFTTSGCSCYRKGTGTDYETYYEAACSASLVETVKDKRRIPNPSFPVLPAWSPDLLAVKDLTHVAAGLALSYQALAKLVRTI